MTPEEWIRIANATALRQEPLSEPLIYARSVVANFWWALQSAPKEVTRSYCSAQEHRIEELAQQRAVAIHKKVTKFLNSKDADLDDVVLRIASEIRAADQVIHELSDVARSDKPEKDYRIDGERSSFYLIPSTKRIKESFRTSQSYTRRGLRYHRIIPTQIDNIEIQLVSAPPTLDEHSDKIHALAGLFVDFKPSIEEDENSFILSDAECTGGIETVALRHLKNSETYSNSLVLAWPELTFPNRVRNAVVIELKQWLIRHGGSAPALIVAGSWHENIGGKKIVNRSHIIDCFGNEIISYDKMEPFYYRGKKERIQSGKTIPIILLGNMIISFAICKDFCDLSDDIPHKYIDYDVILVPSMGEEVTLNGHIANASAVRVKYDARVFVVQQSLENKNGVGYVIPLPDCPSDCSAEAMSVSADFAAYQVSFGWTGT